jgi:hypothetical protein
MGSSRWCSVLLATCALACSGEADPPPPDFSAAAGTSGHAPPSSPPARSVKGTWAIVAGDMDGTVVELDDSGNGRGCMSGWAPPDDLAGEAGGFCGPVTGSVGGVDGDSIDFELALTGFGGMLYSFHGTLSAKGDRIGGFFSTRTTQSYFEQPGAAIRYDRSVESDPYPLGQPWPVGAQKLVDSEVFTPVVQEPFQVDRHYRLKSGFNTLGGDLGNYLGTEISIETRGADEFVFRAGPVSPTRPDIAIGLTATYSRQKLVEIVVDMPLGDPIMLLPAP